MPGTKGMTPKLQKKMEEIMEELGMMSPRIKPVKKKDGGLMEAIEKVKAKGMKDGGDVAKPKMRPKSLKADKTEISSQQVDTGDLTTEAENNADIIIITGGLGPTKDDITKHTLADYFEDTLVQVLRL